MLSLHFIKWKILGGHICGNYQTICLGTTTDRQGRQAIQSVALGTGIDRMQPVIFPENVQ